MSQFGLFLCLLYVTCGNVNKIVCISLKKKKKYLQTWQLLGTTDEIRDPVSGGVVWEEGTGWEGGGGGGGAMSKTHTF